MQKRSPKRSRKKCKRDILTDDSFESDGSGDRSEENDDKRISEYSLTQPRLKAKHHYQPSNTQLISSCCMAPSDINVIAISEPEEHATDFESRVLSVAMRQSETNTDGSIGSEQGVSGTSCGICNVNVSTEHK